jgi:hypothetical protein
MLFTHGFKDYNIVIFENDSKDNTRNLLKQWAQRDSKVKLLDCCDDGSCDCKLNIKDLKIESGPLSKKRIAKMAHFRNKYVDYVKKNYKDYDYMLVIDIDIRGGIYKEGYQSCFADDDWDAIFARGIRPFPFLFGSINYVYDWLAYADNKYKKKDLNLLDYIDNHFKLQKKYDKKIGETMEPIKSAFNGAGIYRIKTLINSDAKYSGINSCEHIDFNDSLKSYKLYANPSFIINMGVDNDMAILKK